MLAVGLVGLWWPGSRKRLASFCVIVCLAILWLAGSPFFANRALTFIEGQFMSRPATAYPGADAIVVLGGDVARQNAGGRAVLPGQSFDRLYLGHRLYRAGKAPVMILSGGGIRWQRQAGAWPEARGMAALARQLGIPEKALIPEGNSRNTRENAWYVRKILREKGLKGSVLLVTSAFHMPRARACFEKLGIPVISCPADFRADPYARITIMDFLPDAGALDETTIVLREFMGMVYYNIRGWI